MIDIDARDKFISMFSEPDHTIELYHDKGSYHVSKRSLVIHSEVFKKMLGATMAEAKEGKIDVNQFTYDAVGYVAKYLLLVMPDINPLSTKNQIDVWRFAHMYEMAHLLGEVGKVLDNDMAKVEWATALFANNHSMINGLYVYRAKAKRTLAMTIQKHAIKSICQDSLATNSPLRCGKLYRVCCKHTDYIALGYVEYDHHGSMCQLDRKYKQYCCACRPKTKAPNLSTLTPILKAELLDTIINDG